MFTLSWIRSGVFGNATMVQEHERLNANACFIVVGLLFVASGLLAQMPDTLIVAPKISTSPVLFDADDPAIWIHPTNSSQSLIIGTDKGTYPNGGLFVWNMDGSQQQRINISHPNNVDVRYGMQLGETPVDIAVVSMRDHRQIRIFKIDPTSRTLEYVNTLDSTNVINRMFKSPYGLTLYQRPTDGAIFAIVSSAHNESKKTLWQIQLEDDDAGRVKGTLVREFGDQTSIVEGMVADDELGYLYIAEEAVGIHKYYADPVKGNNRLALFATGDGISGNREGLALYKCSNGSGYLLVSNPDKGAIKVYRREGDNGNPHAHQLVTTIVNKNFEAGDGLEVTNSRISAEFPNGFLVWHYQAGRQFRLYAWEDIAQNFLTVCSQEDISTPVQQGAFSATAKYFALMQNYPNPFNPETAIRFQLPGVSPVKLIIYNVKGEEINILLDEMLQPGFHTARWNGRDETGRAVASGVYLYKLYTEGWSEIRKMMLLR